MTLEISLPIMFKWSYTQFSYQFTFTKSSISYMFISSHIHNPWVLYNRRLVNNIILQLWIYLITVFQIFDSRREITGSNATKLNTTIAFNYINYFYQELLEICHRCHWYILVHIYGIMWCTFRNGNSKQVFYIQLLGYYICNLHNLLHQKCAALTKFLIP